MDSATCSICEDCCEQPEQNVLHSLLDNNLGLRKSMTMKDWFRQLQPVQLYVMLVLTFSFCCVQIFMSHTTHALTLLVDSYHSLCNILALVGSLITIKYGSANLTRDDVTSNRITISDEGCARNIPTGFTIVHRTVHCRLIDSLSGKVHFKLVHNQHVEEKRLKNTFGWARIDVLVILVGCVFLASLCFSLLVEALQTLLHIEHHDEMHQPIPVMCVGATGLLLNGLCYLLIGGYTAHQGSFLHVYPGGELVDRTVSEDPQKKCPTASRTSQRQGLLEINIHICCVFVIICSLIVYLTDENIAKYVDPALSIVSAVLLLVFSYPYMKESGLILLQTIPDTINIDSLCSQLVKAFPDIVNVHDLHIWRLTPTRVFSTAHIIFSNSKDYIRITNDIIDFFHNQGITHVTVQPEFLKRDNISSNAEMSRLGNPCLIPCREQGCYTRHCCSHNDQELKTVTIGSSNHQHHSHNHKHHHSK
ncbi:hypothetical protein L9F63_013264, partial [Diploptera punctata]